jgi:hypothetical protein
MYGNVNLLDIDASNGMVSFVYKVGLVVFGEKLLLSKCIPRSPNEDVLQWSSKNARPYLKDKRIAILKGNNPKAT